MALDIQILNASLWPAFAAFAKETWPDQPQDDSWLRWRFLEAPGHEMRLVLRDDAVVACLGLRRRDWVVGDSVVEAGETYAWFCRPDLRMSGLGIRLMKRVMADVTPIIAAGGSDDTQTLLPRLGWQEAGRVQHYLLPLRGEAIAGAVKERTGVPRRLVAPAFDWLGAPLLRRRSEAPVQGRVLTTGHLGEAARSLYGPQSGVALMALPDPEQSRWLGAHTAQGHVFALMLYDGETLVGCAQLRVYPFEDSITATLLEAYTPSGDAATWRWLVEAVIDAARGMGAGLLRTRTSHPMLQQALAHHRFRPGLNQPVWVWAGRKVALPSGIPVVMNDLEDYALLPFGGL